MRTLTFFLITIALCLFAPMYTVCLAGQPGQAYHQTPGCIDGNCVPNRGTNGYHATRWRPWPGGEPSYNKPIPQTGIELRPIQVPSRDKELDLPVRPSVPGDATSSELSPNDQPGSGIVLPPELRNLTPPKPVEETRPGSSSVPRGPMLPGEQLGSNPQPLKLGRIEEPLRLRSADSMNQEMRDVDSPQLKIRPAGNSQSGLMPEMVPWNDEDKNPIVRQAARITGNQVQHTIRLDEETLPNANENQMTTIRIQSENPSPKSIQVSAIGLLPSEPKPATEHVNKPMAQESEWHPSAANAPAILPNIEAQPLPPINKPESTPGSSAVISPLRGVSQGNPLRP